MKKLLYLLLCCLLSIPGFTQNDATERGLISIKKDKSLSYNNKYALIIGVNNYKDVKIPALKYAVNDAKSISQMVVNQLGYDSKNVTVLLDSLATRTNILETLQKFINDDKVSENSQLLVYFAGHGTVSKSGNKGFLLNYDAMEGSELSTAISMDEIGRIATECRSKHVLFLIDACYGGFANSRSGSGSGAFIKNVWSQKARHVITAGNSEEKVIESSAWQHSAFTKVLLDALEKGEADVNNDNIVSSSELHLYLEQRISFYAKQKGGKQTPQLGKLSPDDGTIFLELKQGALALIDDNAQMLNDDEINDKLNSKVIITSNVKSARVFVNSIEIGYLNDGKFECSVKPGFHKFELKLEKFDIASLETIVKPDTTITIDLKMDSKMSLVTFNIEPSDAAVILNNNLIGTGSFKAEVPKGRHEILIEKKGFKPEKSIINLVQDETSISFEIQKIIATVELFSSPLGITVSNNSEVLGKTPFTISLGYGLHNLVFTKDDYLTEQLSIDVKESGLIRKEVSLALMPNVLASKQANKLRVKYTTNFFINAGLAAGSYLGGYKYFEKQLKIAELDPQKDSDNTGYKVGKYGSLGLTGIFAIGTVVNFVKILSVNKNKILKKNMEEKLKVTLLNVPRGGGLNLSYNF